MSRVEKTSKNAFTSLLYIIVTTIFGIITRKVFMQVLGESYLGLNGLFTSVLNVLSFAELGLGASISFCFYKPVAENDIPQICALIQFTKKVFRVIMLVIGGLGLIIMPFLQFFIKDYQGIDHFYLYYIIALINTISSYFLVYKTCYQAACQEGYRTQSITTVSWIITALIQIFALLVFKSYLVYLILSCLVNLTEKLVVSYCLTHWYPLVKQRVDEPVSPEAVASIKKNVKSLIVLNIGYKIVTQSDTLITSKFIGLGVVGLISNYTLLQTTVMGFIAQLPSSAMNSMGNLVASENEDVQMNVFGIYELICSWLAIFSFCGLAVFLTPFVSLLFGADKTISELAVFLICLSSLLNFQQSHLDILRNTHGAYAIGRTLGLWQAAVNLLISIPAAMLWGLPGVYLGTAASMLVPYFIRPHLFYKNLFHSSSKPYYKTLIGQTLSALGIYLVLLCVRQFAYAHLSELWAFAASILGAVILFPPLLWLCSRKNTYYGATIDFLKSILIKK